MDEDKKLCYLANPANIVISGHNKVDCWDILNRLPFGVQQSVHIFTVCYFKNKNLTQIN